MPDTGFLLPGTAADDAAVGTVTWASTANALTDNATYATAGTVSSSQTHYLKLTNYAFAIPAGATIDGIEVEIQRLQSAAQQVKDVVVRMVKVGTVIGTNNADTVNAYPTVETAKVYGSPTDLWGTTWTVAEINDATTGIVLQVSNSAATSSTTRVDVMRIRVYYTVGAAAQNLNAGGVAPTSASGGAALTAGNTNLAVGGVAPSSAAGGASFTTIVQLLAGGVGPTSFAGGASLTNVGVSLSVGGVAPTSAVGGAALTPGNTNLTVGGVAPTSAVGGVSFTTIVQLLLGGVAPTSAVGGANVNPFGVLQVPQRTVRGVGL